MRFAKSLIPVLLLGCVLPGAAADAASDWSVSPLFDVRVRQEILDGVYHFDSADPDRDWIRIRSRGGASLRGGDHLVELRLANEHRHYQDPDDVDFDWDELIVDRAAWTWTPAGEDLRLTAGRQDIIWPGGFLMLEGHPLDGSRSIYHNAVRAQWSRGDDRFDVAAIYNPMSDDFVLIDDHDYRLPGGDEGRRLTNGDELGLAARWLAGPWQWSCILKQEDRADLGLPDFGSVTLGARYAGRLCPVGELEAEVALQYQHQGESSALPDAPGWAPDESAWAHAVQAFVTRTVATDTKLKFGGFLYSGSEGSEGGLGAFRAPWGNWPKWSELYIYSLIAEGGDGRVHVAAWENIAAPRIELTRPLGSVTGRRLDGRAGLSWLLAPEPEWTSRGWLAQAQLKVGLGAGFDGHLLCEYLDPGSFHDGENGLPPMDDPVLFLRWQITYTLK